MTRTIDSSFVGPRPTPWFLPKDEEWRTSAACVGLPVDSWFPDRGEQYAAQTPKGLCRSCPVRMACLRYAVSHREQWGIWGGFTMPKGRYRLEALMRDKGITLEEAVALDDHASDARQATEVTKR